MSAYAVAKSLHVVFFVSWFAGLFYLVRLFVYHREALDKPLAKRKEVTAIFVVMEKRLYYYIAYPAMVGTIGAGISLAELTGAWRESWFHAKLALVGILLVYHFVCGRFRDVLQGGSKHYSSVFFRVFNEVATVLLVAIAFLAVTRSAMGPVYGVFGFLALGLTITAMMKLMGHPKG